MKKKWFRLCSFLLTLVMLFQMLPLNILAETIQENIPDTGADEETIQEISVEAEVIGEIENGRTEYSKEFRLSNGLHVAAMYNDAVHYEKDGRWEEIDNTLQTKPDGSITNTAGIWSVSFPQQLSGSKAVTVTKDGYTLSFAMAGELRQPGNLEVASLSAEQPETVSVKVDGKNESFSVNAALATSGQIQAIDRSKALAEAEHKEFVLEKNSSQLRYSDIYTNTDVQYDLKGNQLKESIVMESYNSTLRGYRYTLNTDGMIPVLDEEGNITFFDGKKKNIVMVMPAPFLVDAAEVYNYDVKVNLTGSGSTYTLTYLLPQQWLAEADRAWPVILDPVVKAKMNVSNVRDTSVGRDGSLGHTKAVLECGVYSTRGPQRIFLMYQNLPALTSADVIVGAKLRMYKPADSTKAVTVEVHKVLQTWTDSAVTSWASMPATDPLIEDYARVETTGFYRWDITNIVRGWYEGQNTGMMFKVDDATEADDTTASWRQFYSAQYAAESYMPYIFIYFRNNNGIEDYWDYSTASVGRAGTGYVNNYTGNMTFIRSDIGFGGNLMPVSINHIYNTNDIAKNDYGAGYGWRTSFNQSVVKYADNPDYYIWTDGDGTEHYFKYSTTSTYKDEDGLELTLKTSGSGTKKYSIKDKTGNASYFDTNGRLTLQQNNQATKSSITVTYTTDTGKLIDTITDGAGRVYKYNYTNGLLTSIECKRTDGSVIDSVSFAYDSAGRFTTFTDLDGKTITYTYKENGNLLESATDVDGYKLTYTYSNGQPSRVASVEETDDGVAGGTLAFSYAHNQTTITDHNGNKQILQFNNLGNVLSIQDGEGKAQYAKYSTNGAKDDSVDDDTKKNQLTASSKLQNTVINLFSDSSFENGTLWTVRSGSSGTAAIDTAEHYLAAKSMKLTANTAVQGAQASVPSNESITFSAYVKGSGTISLYGGSSALTSRDIPTSSDWQRVEVTYTNQGASAVTLTPVIQSASGAELFVDCVQLEREVTASRYNIIDNGDFSGTGGWERGDYLESSDSIGALSGIAPAPSLDAQAAKIVGSPTKQKVFRQTIPISGVEGDTYVIAGWAKADSVPVEDYDSRDRNFAVRLRFNNTDGTVTKASANFNPYAGSEVDWQFSSEVAVAKKAYSSITVYLMYHYNANTAYFDGIQMFKEEFSSSYAYDADGNITSTTNLLKQKTKYTYNSEHELTKEVLPTGLTRTYTYDDYHNVTRIVTKNGDSSIQTQLFTYDTYGNVETETVRKANVEKPLSVITYTYENGGNTLASKSDALGNVTTYSYDPDTNVLEWVKYPKDTADVGNVVGSKTRYTYDAMYRTQTVNAKAVTLETGAEKELSAAYTYTNDYLTSITTPKTTYNFTYGAFGLRTAVLVGETELATYQYTNDKNKYLQTLAYGNSDSVEYEYDDLGRVIAETHKDVITDPNTPLTSTITYRYDNDGELAEVYDSATGITTRSYFDFSGKEAATEQRKNNQLYLRLSGTYDDYGRLKTKTHKFADSSYTSTYNYNYNDTISSLVLDSVGQVDYTYDNLFRVVLAGTGINGKQYSYWESADGNTFSNQITKISYAQMAEAKDMTSYDFQYTYDSNGNIQTHTDPYGDSVTYTYDTQNQLIQADSTLKKQRWVWTYDEAGNITNRTIYAFENGVQGAAKSSVDYGYSIGEWKDLLVSYGGAEIEYDSIGNPTEYYNGWNFAWNGRKMTSATNGTNTLSFAYNADGLRTSKTVNGVVHNYYYADGKLVRETYGDTVLDFFYDASGYPYIMKMGNNIYYYITNAQGDVIRLTDIHGNTAAYYQYDPYGKVIHASGSHANINPLKYRAYLHDTETGFYYLQSRYYDPEIGRFISADDIECLGADGTLLSYNLYTYCANNPVNRTDATGNWSMPNWLKVTIGVVAIAGLAVATVCTGGAAAVICGAALSGAIAGGASGAVMGAIGGGISGGLEGALDGACSGFMSGTLIGGATGAASAGINIATGATTVVGNAHGSVLHKLATNMEAGKMAASGQYSKIGINKALKTMGLNGTKRPDVIGIAKNGLNKLVEVVSPRQNKSYIANKMYNILANNPGTSGKVVTWVRNLFR